MIAVYFLRIHEEGELDLGLKGKVAAVAGASRGLGYAIARALAQEGATVGSCARHEESLERSARKIARETGGDVAHFVADLGSSEQARAFVRDCSARFGRLDILVTNAGGPPTTTFMDSSDDQWQAGFDLTLGSVISLIRESVPLMERRKWGRIVNVTSVSVKQPIDGLILSNSIRAGVVGLAKTLSIELAPLGITVNNVCPGYTATERVEDLARQLAESSGVEPRQVIEGWQEAIPMGRLGRPEELADLVAFLASERAAYLTGASIQVDGGYCRGLL